MGQLVTAALNTKKEKFMGIMRIKMLRNDRGSTDGANVLHFEREKEYDVPTDFGQRFIDNGSAELVADKASNDNQTNTLTDQNQAPGTVGDATPVYEKDGNTFLAVAGEKQADGTDGPVTLKPVGELNDDERKALVAAGKLTEDGKVPEAKAQARAPENRALDGAPANRQRR